MTRGSKEYSPDVHGDLMNASRVCTTTKTHKRCPRCGFWLPLAEFGKNKAKSFGVRGTCLQCEGETRVDRAKKIRDCRLRYEYGITLEEFNDFADSLDWRCQICDVQTDDLCVDHCHETGKVRSLLCKKCNAALGLLNDDLATVENALNYLRRYK